MNTEELLRQLWQVSITKPRGQGHIVISSGNLRQSSLCLIKQARKSLWFANNLEKNRSLPVQEAYFISFLCRMVFSLWWEAVGLSEVFRLAGMTKVACLSLGFSSSNAPATILLQVPAVLRIIVWMHILVQMKWEQSFPLGEFSRGKQQRRNRSIEWLKNWCCTSLHV